MKTRLDPRFGMPVALAVGAVLGLLLLDTIGSSEPDGWDYVIAAVGDSSAA